MHVLLRNFIQFLYNRTIVVYLNESIIITAGKKYHGHGIKNHTKEGVYKARSSK